MNIENLNLLIQLIESLELTAKELERQVNRSNVEKTGKAKEEILRLQKQISEVLE